MADSTKARCDIFAKASDQVTKMIGCQFSQRQGYITISRDDGVTHDLSPVGDSRDNFRDQGGRSVYRQRGLGDQGQIFRFPDESASSGVAIFASDREDKSNPLNKSGVMPEQVAVGPVCTSNKVRRVGLGYGPPPGVRASVSPA